MQKPLLLLLLAISTVAVAQKKPKKVATNIPAPVEKKSLTHDVYDFWKDIPERVVSHNGQWFGYALNP
ncbi:MAG: hypothetical protein MUE30_05480, partial [Spirosomaceae bacterium]|nr:hypothetical protein [Spirosomataceae bacterium]